VSKDINGKQLTVLDVVKNIAYSKVQGNISGRSGGVVLALQGSSAGLASSFVTVGYFDAQGNPWTDRIMSNLLTFDHHADGTTT